MTSSDVMAKRARLAKTITHKRKELATALSMTNEVLSDQMTPHPPANDLIVQEYPANACSLVSAPLS